jgi:hypothetical protein
MTPQRTLIVLATALTVALPLSVTPAAAAQTQSPADPAAFQDAMRALWEDHIVWTRLFIISAASNLPDAAATTNRLLQNQRDIGDAIKPFYGDAAGTALTNLLRGHILTAADLVTAAKSGDTTAINRASARWYVNADSIASFLSAANPERWPAADVRAGMRMHLDLTLKEAAARLRGDWAADIAAYDEIHRHILQLADLLSGGIIAQFPRRFS